MEARIPTVNCMLQHSLRTLCACSDSSSPSKWAYAVFWRILPRNYPPPKWDYGGSLLDRTKGNKRNWILVWEDGYCDFIACERATNRYSKEISFGADIFFKMSHEVYNFGEGMVGKVASDYSHKWIYSDSQEQNESSFISSWNASTDHQPKAWEAQFSSGIETIAIISVREGAIQLGSFDKVIEDLTLVLNIQRKFSYLHSIPGVYTVQRPYVPIQNTNNFLVDYPNCVLMQKNETDDVKPRFKRQKFDENQSVSSGNRFIGPMYSIPPLLPYNLGSFLLKMNSNSCSVSVSGCGVTNHEDEQNLGVEEMWGSEDKTTTNCSSLNQKLKSEDD